MTTTEPISADDLIRAAAAVLPEPGDASSLSASSGSADELIARLADQQIDNLMGDEEPLDADAEAVANGAIDAAADLSSVAQSLKTEADEELDEASKRTRRTAKSDASAAPDSLPAAVDVAESEIIIAAAAPSFNPPPHADLDSAKLSGAAAQPESLDHQTTAETSDADAVARELAADVAMLSTPLPSVIEHQAEIKTSSHRILDLILAIPMRVLEAINLPVKPLSDHGREVIGAIGVLTLVNAMGLLLYLAVFAHRHG